MTQGASTDDFDQPDGEDLGAPPVLVYERRERTSNDRPWEPMLLAGERVMVREPKGYWWIHLAQQASMGNELEQAAMLDNVLDKVFDAESAAYVRELLDDEDDDFDVDELGEILNRLRELWSRRRPTGRASGSNKSSRRTGRPSTARAR